MKTFSSLFLLLFIPFFNFSSCALFVLDPECVECIAKGGNITILCEEDFNKRKSYDTAVETLETQNNLTCSPI